MAGGERGRFGKSRVMRQMERRKTSRVTGHTCGQDWRDDHRHCLQCDDDAADGSGFEDDNAADGLGFVACGLGWGASPVDVERAFGIAQLHATALGVCGCNVRGLRLKC